MKRVRSFPMKDLSVHIDHLLEFIKVKYPDMELKDAKVEKQEDGRDVIVFMLEDMEE